MTRTVLFSHPVCAAHDPGPRHPESGARLHAVLDALAGDAFARLERREAPLGEPEILAWAHHPDLVEAILAGVPRDGRTAIDGDTVMSPASGEAARRAAGAVAAAVDAVLAGEADNAFCAVRPPGHHAEPRRAMGFCLFNNVVVGAERARRAGGLTRVAVVDFDVHHGNGTQAAFAADVCRQGGGSCLLSLARPRRRPAREGAYRAGTTSAARSSRWSRSSKAGLSNRCCAPAATISPSLLRHSSRLPQTETSDPMSAFL